MTDLSMGTIALHSEFGGTAGLGELFHTRLGRAFVNLTVDGHHETWPVLSHEFRRWLERKHLEPTGRMPNSSAVSSAIRLLECRAYDGPEREVHIRVASRDTEIYLDLADDRRRVVEIGPNGWRVIDNAPVHFVRAPEMRPLPVPETGGSMDELRSLINVDDDAFVLVTAWLLGGFRVGYEHPLLIIQGPEGSAKSALMAILEGLIDPSSRPAAGLPRTEREFLAEGSTRYLRPYDNITAIPTAMSNALCRHVTSGGHPIIIAGEDMLLGRDLADRSLFVRCDPKEYCLPRSMLLAAFETSAPRLIGAILDIFSRGLRELPNVQPEKLTRMADFELWATAWQNILWPKGTFSAAYRANRAAAAEDQLEADAVASAVRIMMADRAAWTGNATRLYVALAPSFEIMGKKGSPASARDLAVKLRRAGPLLRKIGIEIRFERQGHGRERMISISAALDAAEPNTLSGPLAPSVSKTTPASSASSAKQDDLRSEGAVGTNADARASWDKADDADASTQ